MGKEALTYKEFLEKHGKTELKFKEMYYSYAVYENKKKGIGMKFEVKWYETLKPVETVESCSTKHNVTCIFESNIWWNAIIENN